MAETTETRRITFQMGDCKLCMACVELAPEMFELDEDTGVLTLLKDVGDADICQDLVAFCPEDCIEYDDEE